MTVVVADHPMLAAIPVFVMALVLAGALGVVIWRDRRAPRADDERDERVDTG